MTSERAVEAQTEVRLPGESPCVFASGDGWYVCRVHGWSGPSSQRSRVLVCQDVNSVATSAPREDGTETNCPLEGVHEHVFRGPHRFREWEPGT